MILKKIEFCVNILLIRNNWVLRYGVFFFCCKKKFGICCFWDDWGGCDVVEYKFEEFFKEVIFELEIMVRELVEVLGGM